MFERVQGAVQSDYRCVACVVSLMERFLEALRLVEQTNYEAARGDIASPKDALGATHLDNAVLFNVENHDVLH